MGGFGVWTKLEQLEYLYLLDYCQPAPRAMRFVRIIPREGFGVWTEGQEVRVHGALSYMELGDLSHHHAFASFARGTDGACEDPARPLELVAPRFSRNPVLDLLSL